jgi:hypothetical protein
MGTFLLLLPVTSSQAAFYGPDTSILISILEARPEVLTANLPPSAHLFSAPFTPNSTHYSITID